MKQLTKEEKITAYNWILERIQSGFIGTFSPFVCVNMIEWLSDNKKIDSPRPLKYFPEFIARKPELKDIHLRWWGSDEHHLRIQAVKDTIEELHKT